MGASLLIGAFAFLIGCISAAAAVAVVYWPLREPGLGWAEKARRVFPLRVIGSMLAIVIALPISVMSRILFDMARLAPPPWVLGCVGLMAVAGVALVALWAVRRTIWPNVGWSKWISGCLIALLVRFPNSVLMMLAAMLIIGSDYNNQIMMIGMTFMVLGSLAAMCGAGAIAGQFFGVAKPALPRVANAADWAAERLGVRPRTVFEVATSRSSITSVYPLSGVVIVPTGAVDLLDDRELLALLIWEMAHLAKPKFVAAIRIIDTVFVAVMLGFVVTTRNRSGTQALYIWGGCIGVLLLVRSLARKSSLQADQFAAATGLESHDALSALERVFEHDLLPVVSISNQAATPHLYDRMLAAGMTPAYPRPRPPSKVCMIVALICGMVTAVVLALGTIVACGVSRVFDML